MPRTPKVLKVIVIEARWWAENRKGGDIVGGEAIVQNRKGGDIAGEGEAVGGLRAPAEASSSCNF